MENKSPAESTSHPRSDRTVNRFELEGLSNASDPAEKGKTPCWRRPAPAWAAGCTSPRSRILWRPVAQPTDCGLAGRQSPVLSLLSSACAPARIAFGTWSRFFSGNLRRPGRSLSRRAARSVPVQRGVAGQSLTEEDQLFVLMQAAAYLTGPQSVRSVTVGGISKIS